MGRFQHDSEETSLLRNELVEEVLEMKYAYLLYLQSYKQRTKKVSLGRTLSFFSGQGIRKYVLHFLCANLSFKIVTSLVLT